MLGLVIFGSRGVEDERDRGDFLCPECGVERPYVHKRMRRFFTLYFIPILPISTVGEYVKCAGCGGTFKPAVLEFGRERARFQERVQAVVRDVALKMMVADGTITDTEVEAVCRIVEASSGKRPDANEIRAAGERMAGDPRTLQDLVRDLAGDLSDKGKALVLGAAVQVARADGDLADSERLALLAMGEALGIESTALLEQLQQT